MDHYQTSIDAFNKLAQGYQEKFMDIEIYNDSYDRFIELINRKDANVLDVGCGPGNISSYLISKEPDYKILGIDAAPNMADLAKKNNPSAQFHVLDCLKLDTINQKFDGIICGFCMPYLTKEDTALLISQSAKSLNQNGVFYCSVIEGDYSKSGFEMSSNGEAKAYVYYHEEKYLLNSVQQNSLKISDTIRIPYQKHDGSVQTHLVLIAVK